MSNVIPYTFNDLSRHDEHELKIRAWEAVMASGFRCAEHQRIEAEIRRRTSKPDTSARPTPWR